MPVHNPDAVELNLTFVHFSYQPQSKPVYFGSTSLVAESNMDLNFEDDLSPPLSPSALDPESAATSQQDGREELTETVRRRSTRLAGLKATTPKKETKTPRKNREDATQGETDTRTGTCTARACAATTRECIGGRGRRTLAPSLVWNSVGDTVSPA